MEHGHFLCAQLINRIFVTDPRFVKKITPLLAANAPWQNTPLAHTHRLALPQSKFHRQNKKPRNSVNNQDGIQTLLSHTRPATGKSPIDRLRFYKSSPAPLSTTLTPSGVLETLPFGKLMTPASPLHTTDTHVTF